MLSSSADAVAVLPRPEDGIAYPVVPRSDSVWEQHLFVDDMGFAMARGPGTPITLHRASAKYAPAPLTVLDIEVAVAVPGNLVQAAARSRLYGLSVMPKYFRRSLRDEALGEQCWSSGRWHQGVTGGSIAFVQGSCFVRIVIHQGAHPGSKRQPLPEATYLAIERAARIVECRILAREAWGDVGGMLWFHVPGRPEEIALPARVRPADPRMILLDYALRRLGAELTISDDGLLVQARLAGKDAAFRVGSDKVVVNGTTHRIEAPVAIIQEHRAAPLGALRLLIE